MSAFSSARCVHVRVLLDFEMMAVLCSAQHTRLCLLSVVKVLLRLGLLLLSLLNSAADFRVPILGTVQVPAASL